MPEYLSCAGHREKSTDLVSVDFHCQAAAPLSGKKKGGGGGGKNKTENFPADNSDHDVGAISRSCYIKLKGNITA